MSRTSTIAKRIIVSFLIGIAIGAAITELTFIFLQRTARPPKNVVLTIPPGTAESVAHGEQPPSLPQNMTFVVGDVLVVQNQDSADHQLGPLWIPAGTSGQLELTSEESLAYECSFQTSKYLGLDVREPLTLGTRIYGILYAGIPLGVLIALYSFIMPVKRKANGGKQRDDIREDVQP